MKKPILVIMAAGMGSRFGGLKQMTPVDDYGNSILHFSIYDALQAGFGKAVFIIKEAIEEDFKKMTQRIDAAVETAYVNQEIWKLPDGFTVPSDRVKPWGTGHAVLCAKDKIDGPFAVINADDFYGRGAFETIAAYLRQERSEGDYAMVAYQVRNAMTENGTVTRGICKAENGYLADIKEQPNISPWNGTDAKYTDDGETYTYIPGDTFVSMNLWGYQTSFLDALEQRFPDFLANAMEKNPLKGEFFLPTVTDQLIKSKTATVRVLTTDETWYGVTYKEDLQSVKDAIAKKRQEGLYPNQLF